MPDVDKRWFKENPRGTVVAMAPDEYTGAIYHVWFPYTSGFIKEVREGSFIAVKNFDSNNNASIFSILETVTAMPVHYALGSSPSDTEKAYPGFVVEAAKNAKLDWEQEEPVEHTTKIKCEAIPTNLQIRFQTEGAHGLHEFIESDKSLPMIGEEAFLLTDELINNVINRGLTREGTNVISPCKLVLNDRIDVLIRVDDLLRTHFGVFGFTGAGKSNLMSNIINSLLYRRNREPVKIILFDLMAEYTVMLLDALDVFDDSYLLCLDAEGIPGGDSTMEYLNGNQDALARSVADITRTILPPKELEPERGSISLGIISMLRRNKIRMIDYGNIIRGLEVVEALREECQNVKIDAEASPIIYNWITEHLEGRDILTLDYLQQLHGELNRFIQQNSLPTRREQGAHQVRINEEVGAEQVRQLPLKANARTAINGMIGILQNYIDRLNRRPPANAAMSFANLSRILNDNTNTSLIVVQSNRDDDLRAFASALINSVFDYRRHNGVTTPPILFVFDEADEFIPGDRPQNESYALSRAAVRILARRGRKFGMGMSISTQRVAYLDTTIMAQPHTYLISKLPRKYDRDAMANAFGITEEMMRKTLKFTKGQWLLVSYDAIGIENIPIPVQFPNANSRIKNYLNTKRITAQGGTPR